MLEALCVLPLVELLPHARLFHTPAELLSEQELAYLRLLLQEHLLLDTQDTLSLKSRLD